MLLGTDALETLGTTLDTLGTMLLGISWLVLGILELDPGLVGATEELNESDAENVAFVHSNRIILLLLLSATSKKTPGNSMA